MIMTTTYGQTELNTSTSRGMLYRAVTRVLKQALAHTIAAREQQAGRQINSLLLGFDEETLEMYGTSRRELDETRSGPLPL